MKKFYFTFGSDRKFPYQNGYVIVMADDLLDAIDLFRGRFPDRNPGIVNCSFWYTEEEWRPMYGNKEPYEIIGGKANE